MASFFIKHATAESLNNQNHRLKHIHYALGLTVKLASVADLIVNALFPAFRSLYCSSPTRPPLLALLLSNRRLELIAASSIDLSESLRLRNIPTKEFDGGACEYRRTQGGRPRNKIG
jgi:hypothetical protein